jgi:C4-dicarboxylate-specific signal transduction histidine kinase
LSSSLNTFSALSEKYSGDAKVAKHFKNGLDSLRSVASQIQALKNYSHPKGGSVKESVLVESLFDRALDVVGIKDTRIKINRSFEVDQVECNSLYVTQILVTFLLNAKDALSNSSSPVIDIGIKQHALNGISKFDLFVSDNGPGISQDQPLFDAYYTGKDVGEGSGLGLYVASIMAEETGSLLLAENNHLGGALFAIRMNATQSESTPVAYQ